MHEGAWGAHEHSVNGVTNEAECPGGQSALGGAGETGPGTDYVFVQIIVERSYCE